MLHLLADLSRRGATQGLGIRLQGSDRKLVSLVTAFGRPQTKDYLIPLTELKPMLDLGDDSLGLCTWAWVGWTFCRG